MNLLRTCKETHRLVAESMDRELTRVQRVRIWVHLLACDACSNFKIQMEWIRDAMRKLDDH